MPPHITKVSFRLTTPDDMHLAHYDNTKLSALNVCPTWGVLRYQMHKQMSGGATRALPLECGSAMHEMFAWVRLCTLWQQLQASPPCEFPNEVANAVFWHHGQRLFGTKRFEEICEQIPITEQDFVQRCKMGAIAVLDSSGYYDDPSDKRRTLSNMYECALAYIDKVRWQDHIWMRDPIDPTSDVGIEIPFDIVVSINYERDEVVSEGIKQDDLRSWRYTGKIDGIHWHNNKLTLGENKTASRLNDAWANSFYMASQVTGYCIAASVFTEEQVRNADIFGLSIPLPKSYDFGGVVTQPVTRNDYHFDAWAKWFLHSVQLYEEYQNNPYDAPRYTHSCNRYFRSCSMLPFCDAEESDQRQIVEDMVNEEWSPLHEKVGD